MIEITPVVDKVKHTQLSPPPIFLPLRDTRKISKGLEALETLWNVQSLFDTLNEPIKTRHNQMRKVVHFIMTREVV